MDFVSITETLDTSTPFGKAMIGILSVFAQLERETIAERMRMGHIKRAENGLRGMGGDYDPSGYERVDGVLKVKEDEAKHIKRLYDLYEQYHSITKVQSVLKNEGFPVWRFRRYRDILSNTLYIGLVSFAGKTYNGQHEPIISHDQFHRVQELLKRHKGHNAHKAKKSLLSGLIYCDKCGEAYLSYSTSSNNGPYYYYVCRARRFPSEYEQKCNNKIWNRQKLNELLIEEIKNITFEKMTIEKQRKIVNYDKKINDINKKIEKILDLYASSNQLSIEYINKQLDMYNLEKEELIYKKNQQEQVLNRSIDLERLNELKIHLDKDIDFNDKQAIINNLIKSIRINDETIKIEWYF